MAVMAGEDWRALATHVAGGHGPWRLPTMPPTRPEQMVTLAAHAQLSEDEASQIRALGQQLSEQEWHAVMTLARAERLATLVYAQLAATGLLSVMPPDVYATFAEHYRETLLTNLRIRTAQGWLLDQLAADGVASIPLKGIVLVERLYGNPGWRPTRDIDMLVRRDDVDRIGALLGKRGYIPEAKHSHANAFGAISQTETKYTRDDSPMIELHWGLSKRPAYRRGLAEEGIWSRAGAESWRGRTIQALAPSDELRYLAVHCTADHAISQLHWLVDIAELVRKMPTAWRWDRFVAETIAAGLATPVGLALAQCSAVLRLAVPEDALAEMLWAARAPAERAAWQSAWAAYLSREWMNAHLRDIRSSRERALFVVRAWVRRTAIAAHMLQPPPTEG
jgi:putative nucleotidyltransferase-like protein